VERLLVIALGGAIGTVMRYLTSILAARWLGSEFPYGTLIVNLFGAFVIGLVQEVGTESLLIRDNMRLFLTTGMMGGLTTYSTFSYETVALAEDGQWTRAALYVALSVGLSLVATFAGFVAARELILIRGRV